MSRKWIVYVGLAVNLLVSLAIFTGKLDKYHPQSRVLAVCLSALFVSCLICVQISFMIAMKDDRSNPAHLVAVIIWTATLGTFLYAVTDLEVHWVSPTGLTLPELAAICLRLAVAAAAVAVCWKAVKSLPLRLTLSAVAIVLAFVMHEIDLVFIAGALLISRALGAKALERARKAVLISFLAIGSLASIFVIYTAVNEDAVPCAIAFGLLIAANAIQAHSALIGLKEYPSPESGTLATDMEG